MRKLAKETAASILLLSDTYKIVQSLLMPEGSISHHNKYLYKLWLLILAHISKMSDHVLLYWGGGQSILLL